MTPPASLARIDAISCAGARTEGAGGATVDGAARAPERSAFDVLYDENVDFVWRSARRLGVAEPFADDVVQQTFLVVYRRLAEFEHRSSLKTWLFSILLHVIRDHRRTMRRKSPHWSKAAERVDPETLVATADDPAQALEHREAMRLVEALLDTLSDDKRTVFVLAELEQMTANEICEATGMTQAAVYSRLRAARIDFERAAASLRRSHGKVQS